MADSKIQIRFYFLP